MGKKRRKEKNKKGGGGFISRGRLGGEIYMVCKERNAGPIGFEFRFLLYLIYPFLYSYKAHM